MMSSLVTTIFAAFFSLFGGLTFSYLGAAVAETSAIIANEAPSVLTISIAGHDNPSIENQRAITLTGTIEDHNGDIDVTKVSLDFFRNTAFNSSACTADPNNCYHVTSCLISYTYGDDTTLSYNCFITIDRPYAFGDWKAIITATDVSLDTGARELISSITPLGTAQSGLIGSLPIPEEVPVTPPYVTPPVPTKPVATLPTPTDAVNTIGVDRIAQFYSRIEKNEPATRGQKNHTESYGEPLIVAGNNTGLAVFDLSTTPTPQWGTTLGVIVEVPAGASTDWITIYVDPLESAQFPAFSSAVSTQPHLLTAQAAGLRLGERTGISPVGLTVFHVYARNSRGIEVSPLSAAARITLVLPEDLSQKKSLGLYRLDTMENTWVEQRFEDLDTHTLSFKSSELGYFALFDAEPIDQSEFPEHVLSKITCRISIILLLLILAGLSILLVITLRRKDEENSEEEQQKEALSKHADPGRI